MIQEITLSEVADRLKILEDEVKTISTILKSQPAPIHIEFVIQADGHEVWSGTELPQRYPEIRSEYPNAQISIGWRSSPVVLV